MRTFLWTVTILFLIEAFCKLATIANGTYPTLPRSNATGVIDIVLLVGLAMWSAWLIGSPQ